MKSIFTLVYLTVFAFQSQSQIFSSGFENNNGTPLSSYTMINNDGLSVPFYAPVLEFDTAAWIQFYDGYDNKIAFSTSWYDPAGQSDDWLITPAIAIPDGGEPTLYWKAKSYDFENLEDYDVRVSTTDNQMESFTDTVLTVEGEQPFTYITRSLDLSDYQGQTIHLAFVNTTVNGYYLALDDLYLSNSSDCNLPDVIGVTSADLTESSFTVNWDATPGIAMYDVGLTTFTTPVTSEGAQSELTKSYDGLEQATRYQFFLKNADCGSGWATPTSIWTAAIPPYSYDFEYTDENYGEYDSDGWTSYTWINGFGENAQNGDGYVFNNTSTSFDKDDWIFSYPIKLDMDEELTIKYHAKMGVETADPANLIVSVATAPNEDSNIEELSDNTISGGEYVEYTSTYTAAESGVYYFGFGNVTPIVNESAALRLDNITFTSEPLSVKDFSNSAITVFPNPVVDRLYVHADENINGIRLYTIDGKLIKSYEAANEIEFSTYPQGIYLVKVITPKATVVKKIVK